MTSVDMKLGNKCWCSVNSRLHSVKDPRHRVRLLAISIGLPNLINLEVSTSCQVVNKTDIIVMKLITILTYYMSILNLLALKYREKVFEKVILVPGL